MMWILTATALAGAPWQGQVQPGDKHYDLEELYFHGKFAEGLALTDQRLKESPDDIDLYWTRARFLFEIAEVHPRDAPALDKQAHYSDMLATVERGMQLDPDYPALRFARGAAMARLGTTRGVLSSLFMAKDIETDWKYASEHPTWRYASIGGVQVLPCDAWHALGIFYRMVPDRWIVQVLAGTRGDMDKSLELHQKTVECKPDEPKNWKELGVTQLCIGQQRKDDALVAQGRASLERAAAITPRGEKERIDVAHSKALLADPKLACGYSRDGQQDLDASKLE
jgi:tetratricopeptide (TPR) repeat protein